MPGGLGMTGKALSHQENSRPAEHQPGLGGDEGVQQNLEQIINLRDFPILWSFWIYNLSSLNPAVPDCHLKFLLQNQSVGEALNFFFLYGFKLARAGTLLHPSPLLGQWH